MPRAGNGRRFDDRKMAARLDRGRPGEVDRARGQAGSRADDSAGFTFTASLMLHILSPRTVPAPDCAPFLAESSYTAGYFAFPRLYDRKEMKKAR